MDPSCSFSSLPEQSQNSLVGLFGLHVYQLSFNAIRRHGNSLMNFGIFQSTKSQTSLKIGNFGSFFYGTSRNHQMVQLGKNGPGVYRMHAKTQLNRCIKTCCKQIRFFDGQELAHNPHFPTFPPAVSDQQKRTHHL